MKHNLKIYIFLLWSNFMFGQTKYPSFSFGLMAGINNGTFVMPDNTEYKQFAKLYLGQFGHNLGVITKVSISKNISFESGIKIFDLKSKTKQPELIFADDFVVIDDKIYSFEGKLFINSKVEFSSIRIPLQISIDLLNSKNFNIFLFGGFYKDFVLKFKNDYNRITTLIPLPQNEIIAQAAETNFKQNYNNIFQNLDKEVLPDKQGSGFNYGLGIKYKKIDLNIDFNRPENTFNQGAIYRFNSTSLNIRYFIKN